MRCYIPRLLVHTLLLVLLLSAESRGGYTLIENLRPTPTEPQLLGPDPLTGLNRPSVLETLYGEQNLRRVDDNQDTQFRHTGQLATAKVVAKFSSVTDRFGYLLPDNGLRSIVLVRDRRGSGYFPEVNISSNPDAPNGKFTATDSGDVFYFGMRDLFATSEPSLNRTSYDQMVTFEIVDNVGHPENAIGSYVLAFEDTPPDLEGAFTDLDFQDLVVEVSGVVPVPEPLTALLATATLYFWAAYARYRRSSSGKQDSV